MVNSLKEIEPPSQESGGITGHFSLAIPLFLGSLFVLPLIINPNIFESFDQTYLYPRLWWIYVVILPSVLLMLFNWSSPWKGVRPPLTIVLILIAWLTITTLLNRAGWAGWWGQLDRADGVLMHMLYALVLLAGWRWAKQDHKWQQKLGIAILIGGSLLALTNILQQLHLMGVPNGNAFTGVTATLFGGTLGNRGYLGGAMALLLPFTIYQAGQVRIHSNLYALGVLLMSWALWGSFTRAAWLAGLLGLLGLLAFRVPWRIWGAVAVGFILWGGTTFFHTWGGTTFSHATDLLNAKVSQGIADNSGRTILWKSALYGIKEKPLFGWGTPALIKTFHVRPLPDLMQERGIQNIKSFEELPLDPNNFPSVRVIHQDGKRENIMLASVNKVHNEYMDYALTYGIPAALCFVALLTWAIWSSRLSAPGISTSLLAYAFYIFLWPEIIRFAPIAWLMMGIALSRSIRDEAPENGLTSPASASPAFPATSPARKATPQTAPAT